MPYNHSNIIRLQEKNFSISNLDPANENQLNKFFNEADLLQEKYFTLAFQDTEGRYQQYTLKKTLDSVLSNNVEQDINKLIDLALIKKQPKDLEAYEKSISGVLKEKKNSAGEVTHYISGALVKHILNSGNSMAAERLHYLNIIDAKTLADYTTKKTVKAAQKEKPIGSSSLNTTLAEQKQVAQPKVEVSQIQASSKIEEQTSSTAAKQPEIGQPKTSLLSQILNFFNPINIVNYIKSLLKKSPTTEKDTSRNSGKNNTPTTAQNSQALVQPSSYSEKFPKGQSYAKSTQGGRNTTTKEL